MSRPINEQTDNIYFVNVAKTLAIFLVALSHLPVPSELYSVINSFHMPLFFLITGYLLSMEKLSFKTFFIKKVQTLLVPYYIFSVISFIFWYFIGRKYGDDTFIKHDITKYLIGILWAIPSKEYLLFNLPLWFLPSLLCTEILLYWIRKFCKRYAFLVVILCFGTGILLREINFFRLPFGIDVSLFALLFVQTGKWLRDKDWINNSVCLKRKSVQIVLSIVFLGITIFISQINQADGFVLMYKCHFNNYLLFIVGAFTGSLFIFYLSNCFFKSGLFNFYGRNTLFILAFHLICFSLIKGMQVLLFRFPLDNTDGSLPVDISYVIFTFIILAPVIRFVNQYVPFLIGRKKNIL